MSDALVEGGDLSEGELEEGEVLSSDEEGDQGVVGEGEGGEDTQPFQGSEKTNGQDGAVVGEKRPAPDSNTPNPKAAKLDPSPQKSTAAPTNSDAEEGEIFSDDEEAAYFPQLIKSRSSGGVGGSTQNQERESEASGSDAADERKKFSRGRGISTSPEKDSFRQRSRERERDNEPKSLASLFFEDRDGTRSELSDDGKESRSEKRGDQSRHSGSPSRSSRDRDRDRDRDRTWGDRTKRERKYHRGKDSRHGRDRDGDRDHDSNADSSDDESPWSYRGSRSKGYQSYQRGGRKSTYQSKYGQKHDRFGGVGGGRRDNTQQSSWNTNSGRTNTIISAQQFKKRREKGLSLLATPKIKPSDNLDQFNYPAPPSWYLEAVEKWERERGQDGKAASDQTGKTQLTAVEAPATSQTQPPAGITVKPPPLFPPQQAQFPQPANPTSASLFGEPPAGLPPIPGQVANIAPAMPIQVPSLFPPPTGTAIPPFLPPGVALNTTLQAGQLAVPQGSQGENSLVVKGGGGVVPTVQAVNVSSLPLNVSSTEVEDDDEGGMKIALETPTPQPNADTKTFSLFKPTEQEGEAIKEDNPELTKANDVPGKGSSDMEDSSSDVCGSTKEDIEGEGMEVEVPPEKDKIQTVADSQSETSTVPSAAAPSSSPVVATPSDPAIITSSNTTSPVTTANVAMDSPSNPPPVSVPTTENKDSFAMKNSIGSDHEEDSDYDKYLDQLDEEEDQEDMVGSSLVGVLSSDLLKNNPLDEDFPAINPVNESKDKEESLLSLLGESVTTNREERNFHGKAKGSRKKGSHRSEWWNRQENSKNSFTTRPAGKLPCRFYLNGFCKHGDECQFSHDGPRPKKKGLCKFYLQDTCAKGENCLFYHGEFPCKFFHTNTVCRHGDKCKFSHNTLTEETRELLAQVLEPSRNPLDLPAIEVPHLAPPISTTSPIAPHNEGFQLLPGGDAQVKVHFPSVNPLEASQPQTSPLLISIPNHVLEKALVVSIPRQKLGPPFGTVPISAPSASLNQAPVAPSSHPPAVPQPPSAVPSFAPHPSQVPAFRPPNHQPNLSSSIPPAQSVPPGNFPVPPQNFPMPPRPSQPISVPPQPSGWHSVPVQPVPLFPPNVGAQQKMPIPPNAPPSQAQIPPGQPPPPHVPPQYHLPPSERKGLLPTPPSHMRIDPKNIQWPEEHKPEYWEAPDVLQQSGRPISHPPPQFGLPPGQQTAPFGPQPPAPHVPQAVGSGIQPPRQQVVATGMDPRQNRMEPRPGGNIDPRRGGTLPPHQVMGSGDPRQVGGPQMDPPRPPAPYPTTGSVPPPQASMQGQGIPPVGQQQWPLHQPAQQPMHHPPFPGHPPNPIPYSSSSGIPGSAPIPQQQQPGLPAMGGAGQFVTAINSQPSLMPPQPPERGMVWGMGTPNSMAPQSNIPGPREETATVSEIRPLRIDPRTKYSQFKIKAKGSPSSSSPGSILKGKESNGPTSDQNSREKTGTAQMPKLLQEPPPQQRPFDPRELFDSTGSKDEPSEYQTAGPFGSTFGSYFMRSSSEAAESTTNMPYGEIHMTSVVTSDASKNASNEENQTEITQSVVQVEEGDSRSDETKKAVPSYLAELGVGLGDSDLTIDSAFSSLDKKDDIAAGQGDSKKTEITAKKLPNIFSLGTGTL